MKIKQLFTVVSINEFACFHQAPYEMLLEGLNDRFEQISSDDCEVANNLQEAYRVAGKNVIRAIKKLRGGNHEIDSFVESQGFVSAWLLDGGRLQDLNPNARSEQEGHDERNPSAHWILFMNGFGDASLALKAIQQSLSQRFESEHHVDGARATDSFALVMRLSLMGFNGTPNPATYLFSNPVTSLYLNNLCPPVVEGARLKTIAPEFLNEILDYCKIDEPAPVGRFNKILKCLVYNPGLRLKALGCSTVEIIDFFEPLIDKLEIKLDDWLGIEASSASRRLFRRQLYLNLFCPFSEDLQYLHAKPHELLGHPELDEPIPDLLLETMQGPYSCHSGKLSDGDSVPTYQLTRLGFPADVDMVLEGALKIESKDLMLLGKYTLGPKARMIFSEFGKGAVTTGLLESLLKAPPGAELSLGILPYVERFLSFDKHDDNGQLGIMALMAVLGRKHQINVADAGKIGDLKSSAISEPAERVRISDNPYLAKRLFQFMEAHQLLDGELLHWLGFTSNDLKILSPNTLENCGEVFLAHDLAL